MIFNIFISECNRFHDNHIVLTKVIAKKLWYFIFACLCEEKVFSFLPPAFNNYDSSPTNGSNSPKIM